MSMLKAGRPSKGVKETELKDLSDRQKKIRINFDLPEELHMELKIYALKEQKTVKEILTEQIKILVSK